MNKMMNIILAGMLGFNHMTNIEVKEYYPSEYEFQLGMREQIDNKLKEYKSKSIIARGAEEILIEEMYEEEVAEEVIDNKQYWNFEISYYCGCWSCTQNGDLTTASGTKATQYRTVAAPSDIPFGSEIYIEGLGTLICEDRGGYIEYTYDEYGNLVMRLDVYLEDHDECYERGRHYSDGYIIMN